MIDYFNRFAKSFMYFPLYLSYFIKGRKIKEVEEDLTMAIELCPWHKGKSRRKSLLNYVCYLPEWR